MTTPASPRISAILVSPPRSLARGSWELSGSIINIMSVTNNQLWHVGQLVEVQPRTWAGINRPGGHGKITMLHRDTDGLVDFVDVKYTLGGSDTRIDLGFVKPHQDLDRGCRQRRNRTPAQGSANAKENNQHYNVTKGSPSKKIKSDPSGVVGAVGHRTSTKNTRIVSDLPIQAIKQSIKTTLKKNRSEKRKMKKVKQLKALPIRNRYNQLSVHTKTESSETESHLVNDIPREITVCSPCSKLSPVTQPRGLVRRLSPMLSNLVATLPSSEEYGDTSSLGSGSEASDLSQPHLDDNPRNEIGTTKENPNKVVYRSHPMGSGMYPDPDKVDKSARTKPNPPAKSHVVHGGHVTLKDVYQQEQKEASAFIQQVVQGLPPSQPPLRTGGEELEPLSREHRDKQQAFQQLLGHLLNFGEGLVQEDGLTDRINNLSHENQRSETSDDCHGMLVTKFTHDEVEQFVQALVEQDRIMRADGVLVSI